MKSVVRLGVDASAGDAPAPRPANEQAKARAAAEQQTNMKHALVTFLSARGLAPSQKQIARIHASTDATELARWLSRVATATSVEELLK